MTTEQLRELDAWIEENVFEREPAPKGMAWYPEAKHYTTDSAAAMEVLKKCMMHSETPIEIYAPENGDCFSIETGRTPNRYPKLIASEATFEPAICLFAKKLFTK